jgi:hypothetical protein
MEGRMKTPKEILQENNPFYSNTHPDIWIRQFPNIPSINGDVFSSIIRIIENKQKNPQEPVGILVNGEAGTGKTHMIARIREYCEETSFQIKFSAIRPVINYNTPIRHLFRGIISSMAHTVADSSGCTQFHGLLFSMITEYISKESENRDVLKKFEGNPGKFFRFFSKFKNERELLYNRVQTWMIKEIPDVYPLFIKLLFAYGNPKLQQIARSRLEGDIADPEDARLLNVPYIENQSDPAAEEEARNFLLSLGLLLSRYNQCLIICFDQLENLQTEELIKAFGLTNQTIFNECYSLLPLSFMRTLHWERFEEILDRSVIDKMGMSKLNLHGCSQSQVKEIIESRISAVFPDTWETLANWLIPLVQTTIHKNPTSREVISAANAIIMKTDGKDTPNKDIWPSPNEIIGSAYSNERDLILSDLDAWPADYEEITSAVSIFLKSRKLPFTTKKLSRKNILTITYREKRCCVIINTNRNHSAIGASFSTGTQFLHKNPGSICLYLTDPRCIITKPTWGPANQKKNDFLEAGGEILHPSEGEIARFYALYSLSCKITEGDIQIETMDGVRPITHDEFYDYVGSKELFESIFKATQDDTDIDEKKHEISVDAIHNAICEVLYHQPMHIMRADLLAQSLFKKGVSITHDELIMWCGEHAGLYKILQSQQGSMIIVTGKVAVC